LLPFCKNKKKIYNLYYLLNSEKLKQQSKQEQNSTTSDQSCILFLNQLVNKSLNTNNDQTDNDFQCTSILKEITVTSQDSINNNNNEYDGYEEELSNKKNFSSSSSTTNSTNSSVSPKNNSSFVKLGVKLINNKINKLLNNSTLDKNSTVLKKSDSSNSSSSISLSASSSFNKREKMYYNSNSQSDFISYPNQHQQQLQQTQLQLLNSKKLRKLLPLNSGLKNHGNTCFMNCVLQCLFHTSPLADFFITDQFQRDMQYITHHEKFNQLQQQNNHLKQQQQQYQPQQHSNLPQFILTKHFYRLLTSMWRNSYDSNYSAELKHLIGYMNPTFAGGNQNDSHELCVWLLDKLSQELTIRIETPISTQLLLNNAKNQVKIQSLSFIEELFQVQFKSTVICSKCNYKSSKYETDMMLSLPLPQKNTNTTNNNNNNKNKQATNKTTTTTTNELKQKQRRSLYAHLILSNQPSIKNITDHQDLTNQQLERSRSKFYMPTTNNDSVESKLDESEKSENESNEKAYLAPFHVKIGINIQISSVNNECTKATTICTNNNNNKNGDSSCSSVSSTTSSISSTSSVAVSSSSSTSSSASSCPSSSSSNNNLLVSSITINELRRNIASTYQLRYSDLVFIDLNRIQLILNDSQSVKDTFLVNKYNNDLIRANTIDSLCVVELNSPTVKTQPNMPLINIIGINVYYETISSYNNQQQQQTDNCDSKPTKKCVCYGLPFVLLINRDCSYSDLCKKLLEAQFKYFKDKIMLKYKVI
jgi:hypothetical protein